MRLLERDAEIEALRRAVTRAVGWSGSIAVVSGEAGSGKTALVGRLVEEPGGKVRSLVGACDDLITRPAFGPWLDIARRVGGPLAEALEAHRDPSEVLRAIADEVGREPTLIVLDDVHWADDATLDSLGYLLRRIETLPTVVVITYRTDDVTGDHPLLGLLGRLHGDATVRLALDPLSESAVARLADGSEVDPAELYEVTGGNPFFVHEVLAAAEMTVPPTVRDAVLARLRLLSEETRDVVALVAVSPSGLEHELVESLPGDNVAAVAEAEEHGVLDDDGDRLRFHNELARRVVEETMSAARVRALHQQVLGALRDIDADGTRLLHHAVGAGDIDTLLTVGPAEAERYAASGAHRHAASLLAMILDHADQLEPSVRAELLYDYAVELHRLNRLEAAAEAAAAAVAAQEGQDDATALGLAIVELARNQHFLGQTGAALESTERAISVLERGGEDEALASAYASLAALHVWRHRMKEALSWGERARRLATATNRRDILCDALNYLGVAKVLTNDDSGFADLAESVAIAREIGNPEFHARGANNLALACYNRLRYEAGIETLQEAVAEAAEAELLSLEYNMRALIGQGLLMVGRWEEAESELRPLVEQATDDLLSAPSFGYLGRLLMRKDLAEGDALIDRGLGVTGIGETLLRFGSVAVPAMERAWLAGDTATAARLHDAVFELAATTNSQDWLGTVALYAARAGLEVTPPDPCPPSFRYGIEGDWERAAAAWQQVGDPYERAIELILGGQPDLTDEALRILDELGAARTATWARNLLESLSAP